MGKGRLINEVTLSEKCQSLSFSHMDAVGTTDIYRYLHRLCSKELASIVPLFATLLREATSSNNWRRFTVSLNRHRISLFDSSLCIQNIQTLEYITADTFVLLPVFSPSNPRLTKLTLTLLSIHTVRWAFRLRRSWCVTT